jgi:hypothetical protein
LIVTPNVKRQEQEHISKEQEQETGELNQGTTKSFGP